MERRPLYYEQVEEAELELNPFTNKDFRRLSQELLSDDANVHRIVRDAREEIHNRYELLFTKNPKRAELVELLLLNKIAKNAFSAVTYGDVIHVARDIIASEGSFESFITPMASTYIDDCTRATVINDYLFYREVTYKQSVGKHLNAVSSFLDRITYETTNSMTESSHPHHNIGQFAAVIDQETFALKRSTRKDILAREDIFSYWPDATMKDNAKVSLDLLLHLWLSGSRHAQRLLTKEEFMPFYLQHIGVLSRASTINSRLHAKLHDISPTADFYNLENKELDINEIAPTVHTLFVPSDTSGRLTYAHPSLSEGAWPKASQCPATTELTLPDPDKQAAANDFFDYFTTRFGVEVPRTVYTSETKDGEYSRTNAILLLTLLFAQHTALDNLPKQSQTFSYIRGTL